MDLETILDNIAFLNSRTPQNIVFELEDVLNKDNNYIERKIAKTTICIDETDNKRYKKYIKKEYFCLNQIKEMVESVLLISDLNKNDTNKPECLFTHSFNINFNLDNNLLKYILQLINKG